MQIKDIKKKLKLINTTVPDKWHQNLDHLIFNMYKDSEKVIK